MLMSRHQKSPPKTRKSVGQIALQLVASDGYTDEAISVLNQCGDKITLSLIIIFLKCLLHLCISLL